MQEPLPLPAEAGASLARKETATVTRMGGGNAPCAVYLGDATPDGRWHVFVEVPGKVRFQYGPYTEPDARAVADRLEQQFTKELSR